MQSPDPADPGDQSPPASSSAPSSRRHAGPPTPEPMPPVRLPSEFGVPEVPDDNHQGPHDTGTLPGPVTPGPVDTTWARAEWDDFEGAGGHEHGTREQRAEPSPGRRRRTPEPSASAPAEQEPTTARGGRRAAHPHDEQPHYAHPTGERYSAPTTGSPSWAHPTSTPESSWTPERYSSPDDDAPPPTHAQRHSPAPQERPSGSDRSVPYDDPLQFDSGHYHAEHPQHGGYEQAARQHHGGQEQAEREGYSRYEQAEQQRHADGEPHGGHQQTDRRHDEHQQTDRRHDEHPRDQHRPRGEHRAPSEHSHQADYSDGETHRDRRGDPADYDARSGHTGYAHPERLEDLPAPLGDPLTGPIPGLSLGAADDGSTWTTPTASSTGAAATQAPDWRAPGTLAGLVAAEAMTMLTPPKRGEPTRSERDELTPAKPHEHRGRRRDETGRRDETSRGTKLDDYPDDLKPRRSRGSSPGRDPKQPASYADPTAAFTTARRESVDIGSPAGRRARVRRSPDNRSAGTQSPDTRSPDTRSPDTHSPDTHARAVGTQSADTRAGDGRDGGSPFDFIGHTTPAGRTTGRRSTHVGPGSRRQRRSRPTGLSAPLAVVIAIVGGLGPALVDLWLSGRLGVVFSVGFVLSAFAVAASIRRQDVFTAGILPPLAALITFITVGVIAPDRLLRTDDANVSPVLAVLGGLASESWTLVAASALALGTIALRVAIARPRDLSEDEPLEDPAVVRAARRRSGSRPPF